MEPNSSSGIFNDEDGLFSCWGRLKLKFPWNKRRKRSNTISNNTRQKSVACSSIAGALMRAKQAKASRGFRYDPLSYAQNFDEGFRDDDDEEALNRGFSSRFAAPPSKMREMCERNSWEDS